jgi:ribonuclease E
MTEFQVRSDAVDVEQIMRQIRSRIREKRGADYTEQEIRELAQVKLEKFLDPRGIRSNLVQEFRRNRVITPAPPTVGIGDVDVFGSPRPMLRSIRKLLSPILRLFFSPTPMVHAINTMQKQQNEVNAEFHRRFRQREEMDPLYYEVIHNLVVELTRLSIENQNLKMKVESLSSRMDFDERRARALETVVAYKPAPRPERIERPDRPQQQPQPRPERTERPDNQPQQEARPDGQAGQPQAAVDPQRAGLEPRDQGERGERRRRRRRRRRPGQNQGQNQSNGQSPAQSSAFGQASGSGTADAGRTDNARSDDGGDSDGGNEYGGGDNGGEDNDSGTYE